MNPRNSMNTINLKSSNPRLLIKIGGRAFEKEAGFRELAQAIKAVPNIETIIVHGGGAEISKSLQDHDRETRFIDGIRVTQAEDMVIIERVLSETINQRIASWLTDNGVPCERMSGKTERLFVVEPMTRDGRRYGFVGDIKHVNGEVVLRALKKGRIPVISPISADENHRSFNVNADSAAAALAAEIDCVGLVFITDVPGVINDERVCRTLSEQEARERIADGTIKGGMVAKMRSAFEALASQVPAVYITQWEGIPTLQGIAAGECRSGTILYK
ncbi:MAG: acetylglutamate kinase [Deltaproteobacteria bacterium]|nr:MAG: acetylglutamate kinase [Deltaproteobacteria bacterium]